MVTDIGVSNGIMSVILNYAEAMPENIIFDVVYFAEKEQTRQAEIEALGGRVYKINPPSLKSVFKGEISSLFKEHGGEWQALHIHAPHFALFIAPAAKKAGIKHICAHCHSSVFSLKPENVSRNRLLAKPVRLLTDRQFACSEAAGKVWYGSGFEVVRNGIDTSLYGRDESVRRRTREELGLSDKTVYAHIGRTDIAQKNHPFLLKTFAEIYKRDSSSGLILIGGEHTEELDALCRDLGITDAVSFLGIRKDVPALLGAADMFLFPSTDEGLPVSLIEAQAAGLPALVSDSVTDEVKLNGNLVFKPLGDGAQSWAEAALGLKGNFADGIDGTGWDIHDCARKLIDYYRG
jgi:glycosyltransferase involved in cell wall biosynthesis